MSAAFYSSVRNVNLSNGGYQGLRVEDGGEPEEFGQAGLRPVGEEAAALHHILHKLGQRSTSRPALALQTRRFDVNAKLEIFSVSVGVIKKLCVKK